MGYFQTTDKLSLYYDSLEIAEPKAAVIFVHGLGEHIARYRQAFNDFARQGYSCFGFDQRGFGLSEGKRGHIDAFSYYLDDLEQFIEWVHSKTKQPVYLLGHSMGSIIVLNYVLSGKTPVHGILIFSCPIRLADRPNRLFSPVLGKLFKFIPELKIPNLINPEDLSNNPEVLSRFINDSLIEKKVTLNWLHEFTKACKHVRNHAGQIFIPVFIAHGSNDKIADVAGAKTLFEQITSEDKTLAVYDGYKHELLNHRETDRQKVLKDIFKWLQHRLS